MKKKRLIGILPVILIIFYFDSQISQAVSLIKNSLLTDFFLGLTFISSEAILFFFLTSLFLWKEHKRRYILPLWFTLGLSAVLVFLAKVIVHRQRPFQQGIVALLPILEKTNYLIWNFSFPSSHSMLAFCTIPILSKEFPKFKYVWIIFASLIAFSRVYFGLHFLSDVVIGGLTGYFIGFFVLKLEEKNKIFEKVYEKIFRKK